MEKHTAEANSKSTPEGRDLRILNRTHEQPFAEKKYLEINGYRMAYIDEGKGDPIVFQHGNPTSSYLWRNILPHVDGLGRLIAVDLIGTGDSDKLSPSLGEHRYNFATQKKFLFALWEELGLDRNVILVLHDIGSQLGFHWAHQNKQRVQGIAYMESIVMPLQASDFSEQTLEAFHNFTPDKVLWENFIVEHFLFSERKFTPIEHAYYEKPFLIPGEDRRVQLGSDIPMNGKPEYTQEIVADYSAWLAKSTIAKLYIQAEPGLFGRGRLDEFSSKWPNQQHLKVSGGHFIQETTPDVIGKALASFVRSLRE
ncbi:haloalkane dehalogenase [Cytophagaceae bacterium DM2B3-1]|uniref:Haloalkane dehalogenase n=1 Tax=Xanthocytophaga flava TaxID=3048013 RepID=A0ABT7CHB8_9BACT|nr:haloalkane dehalogenase [Xanthocytophaga flavus]MDJ1493062.1 haloalkane dehalogenase [Xanthocytophaga flavus]